MTESELLMLVTGVNLGVYLMVLQHLIGEQLDARRDRRVAAAALAQIQKREAVRDWRDALGGGERT